MSQTTACCFFVVVGGYLKELFSTHSSGLLNRIQESDECAINGHTPIRSAIRFTVNINAQSVEGKGIFVINRRRSGQQIERRKQTLVAKDW